MSTKKINKDLIVINSYTMDNNSTIIIKNNKAIIIDPSFSGNEIIEYFEANKDIKPIAIILTHAHFDHCFDTFKIANKYSLPVYLHKLDKETYEKYNLIDWTDLELNKFDQYLNYFDSKQLVIDEFKLDIILTPGHTTGSICIIYNNYAIVGDTLFYNSYGRYDLENSNGRDIINSIKNLYNILKDDYFVIAGHGKCASFKEIKKINLMAKSLII